MITSQFVTAPKLKGTTAESIIYHEIGHILEKTIGTDPYDIARGIIGNKDVGKGLSARLSRYAAKRSGKKKDNFSEIVPEVCSALLSGVDNEFAEEFARRAGLLL